MFILNSKMNNYFDYIIINNKYKQLMFHFCTYLSILVAVIMKTEDTIVKFSIKLLMAQYINI